jgi:hypothetical protein
MIDDAGRRPGPRGEAHRAYRLRSHPHETGKLGCDAFSFICIPPGSAVMYRVVVYIIMYFIAGLSMRKRAAA